MPGDRKHHTDKFRRCVEKAIAQGKTEDSAYAICTTSLQDAGEPIFEGAEMHHLHLLGATGKARTEMYFGREHLVVPVVALMEGVIHAVNAETPEFVSQATLTKAANTWNGRPVTIGHPKKDGKQCSANVPEIVASHCTGTVFNSRVDGKKLLCEAWIDKARAKKLNPEMYQRLLDGERMEVSVGAYVVTDGKEGDFHGKAYKASWLETTGDHLAFLPEGRGACSIEMGCGAHRAAMHLVTAEGIEWEGDMKGNVVAFFRSLMPRGWGDDEVKQDLREALHEIDPAARNGEILRVTNNEIVYCVYPPSTPMSPYDAYAVMPKMTYWKRGYAFDASTRAFTISSDRAQVEPTTVYETLKSLKGKPAYKDCPACDGSGSKGGNPCEVCDGNGELKVASISTLPDSTKAKDSITKPKPAAASPQPKAAIAPQLKAAGCGCAEGVKPMEKTQRAEIIAALVTDKYSGFKDGDEAILETAGDARLEEFRSASDERKTQATAFNRLETEHRNVTARLKVAEERLRTASEAPSEEDWMRMAPPPIKALLDKHKAEEDLYRTSIIVQLKDLGANTEEELKAKATAELETLAKYAHVTVPDFSGRGLPAERHAASNDDYAPPDPYAVGLKALQGQSKSVN